MTEAEILASLVKRIEAVREEKKLLAGSERDLFAEAKGKHIDGKALRRVLQRRAMDDADREAFDDLVDQYEQALGSKAAVRAAVASGASVRQAAKIAGVTHGVAERAARGVPKNANGGTSAQSSGAVAAPPAPSPQGGVEHPPRAAAPDTDAGWQSRDGAASYELAHRIAGGKEPAPEVDTARTVAVIEALNARVASGELVADTIEIPAFLDRRRAHA